MAAFSFPENPSNGQKVTNADTGVTYVYQTIPGKWDVQVKSFGGEFVDITGDTMTGELKLANTDVSIIKDGKVHTQFGPNTSMMGTSLEVRGNIITLSSVSCRNLNSSNLVKATDLQVRGVSTFEDSANLAGNLTIKQTESDSQDGRLYLKDSDNTTGISLYGAGGGIDLKGNLSFNSTNTNKNIRAYGASSPVIRFLLGSEAGNVVERMSIAQSVVTVNTNFVGNYAISGLNLISSGTTSVGQNLLVGTTSTLTGDVTAKANLLVEGAVTAKANVLVEGDLTLTGSFITSGTNDVFDSQVIIEAPNDNFKPGLVIKNTNNNSSLWNSPQPGTLQFETTSGSNGGSCGIFVDGGASSPSFTMAIGTPSYSLDRVFTFSYNSTYGKRIYMYPNWGNSYANASNLPDATPVTLGYLRNNGLVTQALTSVVPSNDPNDLDDAITTQSSVTVAAQMRLDGRLTVGRGFSLSGCTTDQPTNTSAICLQLYHPITAAAQLLYRGDTTGDDECVQTKASVDAAISAAVPNLSTYVEETDTLGNSYLFQNHANNVGSTLDGFFLFEYSKSSSGMVNIIVNAIKNTSIVNGDVVGTLPEGYRPSSGRWAVFTLINQNKNTTAQCVVTDDGKVTFIQVSGASTKFIGQLTFSTHSG